MDMDTFNSLRQQVQTGMYERENEEKKRKKTKTNKQVLTQSQSAIGYNHNA